MFDFTLVAIDYNKKFQYSQENGLYSEEGIKGHIAVSFLSE